MFQIGAKDPVSYADARNRGARWECRMMNTRQLGAQLTVSAIGLGCMGMSFGYGGQDEKSSIRTLRRAVGERQARREERIGARHDMSARTRPTRECGDGWLSTCHNRRPTSLQRSQFR